MDEVTINLLDLLRRILRSWKFLLICMVAGAVLVDGIGYVWSAVRNRENETDTPEAEEASLEELKEDLADREIVEAEAFSEMYLTTMEHYEKDLAYAENSLKMQLDPKCVPTLTAQFFIDSSQQPGTTTGDVVSSYAGLAVSEDVCQQILETLGWDTEEAYIAELITVDEGTGVNAISMTNEEDDATANANINMNVNENDTNLLTITVIAEEKADCETMMDIIEQTLQEGTGELQKIYGNFDLTLLQRQYVEKADADLMAYQVNQLSGLNKLRNTITNITSSFSDDQLEYYFALISNGMADLDDDLTEEELLTEDAAASSPKIFNIRYILLGLFLGLVAACAWILLRYILAPNLRVKDDLEEVYHFPMLGSLPDGDQKGFLRGDAQNKYTPKERMEMICSGIQIAAEKGNMQSVYLTGTAGDEESKQVMEQIQTSMQGQDVKISWGRSVACDPASLEAMTSADGVVFVEQIDHSPYADIQKEAEFCEMYHVPVIGAVVIE